MTPESFLDDSGTRRLAAVVADEAELEGVSGLGSLALGSAECGRLLSESLLPAVNDSEAV